MHHAKQLAIIFASLFILTGCTTTAQDSAKQTSTKTQVVRVTKRTKANKTAWAKARRS